MLRVGKNRADLRASEKYGQLEREIETLQTTVDDLAAKLDLEEQNLVL